MVYLDNAASTQPDPEVLDALRSAAAELYANPASAHAGGAAAARALEAARGEVAAALEVEPDEVVFTSGGTEADALGVLGPARAARRRHLVVSALEHPAVMRCADALVAEGFTLDVVAPTPAGVVRPEDVAAAVRPDTALVAVMLVNNELGTVQPVADIARKLAGAGARRAPRPHLHVDAVQAFGLMRLRPRALGADSIALSAHKLHGPRGAGALWLRPGARLAPLWVGGGQERGLRGGTENLPALVGFGRAAALARAALAGGADAAVAALRDRFEDAALEATAGRVPGVRRTVTGAARAPHIASLAFPGLPAEPLLHALEARGVFASAGSACASRTAGPSPALVAVGIDDRTAVLRFSLSRRTTGAEIEAAVAALVGAVAELAGGPSP
jgi:cysteine desulfurase